MHFDLVRVMVCRPVVSRYVLWIEWVVLSTGNGVWTSMSLTISIFLAHTGYTERDGAQGEE